MAALAAIPAVASLNAPLLRRLERRVLAARRGSTRRAGAPCRNRGGGGSSGDSRDPLIPVDTTLYRPGGRSGGRRSYSSAAPTIRARTCASASRAAAGRSHLPKTTLRWSAVHRSGRCRPASRQRARSRRSPTSCAGPRSSSFVAAGGLGIVVAEALAGNTVVVTPCGDRRIVRASGGAGAAASSRNARRGSSRAADPPRLAEQGARGRVYVDTYHAGAPEPSSQPPSRDLDDAGRRRRDRNYRGQAPPPDCIASLAAQTLPPGEVLVVDGGSPDRSVEVADSLARACSRERIVDSVTLQRGRRRRREPSSAALNDASLLTSAASSCSLLQLPRTAPVRGRPARSTGREARRQGRTTLAAGGCSGIDPVSTSTTTSPATRSSDSERHYGAATPSSRVLSSRWLRRDLLHGAGGPGPLLACMAAWPRQRLRPGRLAAPPRRRREELGDLGTTALVAPQPTSASRSRRPGRPARVSSLARDCAFRRPAPDRAALSASRVSRPRSPRNAARRSRRRGTSTGCSGTPARNRGSSCLQRPRRQDHGRPGSARITSPSNWPATSTSRSSYPSRPTSPTRRSRSCTTTRGIPLGCPLASAATTSSLRSTSRSRRCARSRACRPASSTTSTRLRPWSSFLRRSRRTLRVPRRDGPAEQPHPGSRPRDRRRVRCASEKQRDFWLGALRAPAASIAPATSATPRCARSSTSFPSASTRIHRNWGRRSRGVVPGIGAGDKLLLWPGGIWNWFDPLTVIRAVHEISLRRDDVRLYFLGVKHPNPHIPDMAMASEAVALADELGLRDRVVFFNFGWVPYAERGRYLLESDVAVSAHFDDVETRFAFRTRFLDCLWAGLPIVATRGDTLGELIVASGGGSAVDVGDVDGWVEALEIMLDDAPTQRRARLATAALRPSLEWPLVVAPLLRSRRSRHCSCGASRDRPRCRGRVRQASLANRLRAAWRLRVSSAAGNTSRHGRKTNRGMEGSSLP